MKKTRKFKGIIKELNFQENSVVIKLNNDFKIKDLEDAFYGRKIIELVEKI